MLVWVRVNSVKGMGSRAVHLPALRPEWRQDFARVLRDCSLSSMRTIHCRETKGEGEREREREKQRERERETERVREITSWYGCLMRWERRPSGVW